MQSRVLSAAVFGIDALVIDIEVDVGAGMPSYNTIGLPDLAVKESKLRVRAAIKSCGYDYPGTAITINLAPAGLRKTGVSFDLPMAIGILAAQGNLGDGNQLKEFLVAGELSLTGRVRPVHGILSIAAAALGVGICKLVVPTENAEEAAIVEGIEVYPVSSLPEAVEFLCSRFPLNPFRIGEKKKWAGRSAPDGEPDFRDVKGQQFAKRAVEVAAAGDHNLLFIGPPGSGKTMISRRISGILPEMGVDEAIETTKIHSVAGVLEPRAGLVRKRPFRDPHHTISYAGLIGGGARPRPGEISLAHNGVLFLDELPEFGRSVLEAMRQPLSDGFVVISRAGYTVRFPSEFMLVAAMNPCPCGFLGHPTKPCSCSPLELHRYRSRISGPLLDRFDIHIEVPALPYKELMTMGSSESSRDIRERVGRARELQRNRFLNTDIRTNSGMKEDTLKTFGRFHSECVKILELAVSRFSFSARAYDKILRVARTISDLAQEKEITPSSIAEAIQYRALEKDCFSR